MVGRNAPSSRMLVRIRRFVAPRRACAGRSAVTCCLHGPVAPPRPEACREVGLGRGRREETTSTPHLRRCLWGARWCSSASSAALAAARRMLPMALPRAGRGTILAQGPRGKHDEGRQTTMITETRATVPVSGARRGASRAGVVFPTVSPRCRPRSRAHVRVTPLTDVALVGSVYGPLALRRYAG
jgi:hypothetical protein